jgi:hypothetical protein
MGRIRNSWNLVKQSFAILRSDTVLMLYPVLSAIACVLATAFVVAGGGIVAFPAIRAATQANVHWQPTPLFSVVGVFVFYLVNYFVMVFFNTALVGAATIRLQGGTPTLRDGLALAWERKGIILQWAVLAATVGTVLKMIEQRAQLIGRLVAKIVGLAWTLASFFVVPILAFEKLGPVDALKRSAEIFRKTWGEEVAGGLSLGLIFFLLTLPGFLLLAAGAVLGHLPGFLIALALMILYFVFLAVASSAVHGIFVAALYRYATTGEVAEGFQAENFSGIWQAKKNR